MEHMHGEVKVRSSRMIDIGSIENFENVYKQIKFQASEAAAEGKVITAELIPGITLFLNPVSKKP